MKKRPADALVCTQIPQGGCFKKRLPAPTPSEFNSTGLHGTQESVFSDRTHFEKH